MDLGRVGPDGHSDHKVRQSTLIRRRHVPGRTHGSEVIGWPGNCPVQRDHRSRGRMCPNRPNRVLCTAHAERRSECRILDNETQ